MDDEIVELLKEQDFKGLELLIELLGNDIIKTICAVLNRPEEYSHHKDAENEVFYKLWKGISQFNEEKSSLKTWVLTITRNTCIDKKRTILRTGTIPLDNIKEHPAYDRYLEKEEFLELIHSLKSEDQWIFLSYYFYQETPQQIAETLNIEATQVYNRLSRGRKKLKAVFEQEGYHGKHL